MRMTARAQWIITTLVGLALPTSACSSDNATAERTSAEDAAADTGGGMDSSVTVDTGAAPDTELATDSALTTDSGADSHVADSELPDAADTATTTDGGADTAMPDVPAVAVCGNGVVELGEACEPASTAGLTTLTQQVARTFTDVNHCSLRCRAIVYSPFGTDITKLGPASPTDLALDRVLYSQVQSNNWNPTTYGGYDYRQYFRIVLPTTTRLDVYSMAQNTFDGGKWYLYDTGGTLYTAMELFTFYSADKSTRVGGFKQVRGNPDASPPYAEHNTIELPAGTYYLAIATPYWTASKPSSFTLYTYIAHTPL